jgi:hypothetical protein
MKVWFTMAVLAAGLAVGTAPPAAADENYYLHLLDDKWPFSKAQLLAEGYKVCAANHRGMSSAQAADIVYKDLAPSTAVAIDVVSAANVALC